MFKVQDAQKRRSSDTIDANSLPVKEFFPNVSQIAFITLNTKGRTTMMMMMVIGMRMVVMMMMMMMAAPQCWNSNLFWKLIESRASFVVHVAVCWK